PSASSFFSASYIRLMSLFRLSSAREIGDVVQVRDDGEHGELEIVLDLLLEAEAPIEELDRHCRRGAEHEPGKEAEDQRYPRRVLRIERRYRAIDHADAGHALGAPGLRDPRPLVLLPVELGGLLLSLPPLP